MRKRTSKIDWYSNFFCRKRERGREFPCSETMNWKLFALGFSLFQFVVLWLILQVLLMMMLSDLLISRDRGGAFLRQSFHIF